MPVTPTASKGGNSSISRRWRRTSARDVGKNTAKQAVFDYCEEDVEKSAELLRAMLRPGRNTLQVDAQRVMFWSEYSAKAIARIQAQGMPIDMDVWDLIQENKATIVHALLLKYDPSFGHEDAIYTPDGRRSGLTNVLNAGLIREGIHAWPRLCKAGGLTSTATPSA